MKSEARLSTRSRGVLMLVAEAVDHLTARVHEFHRAIADIPFNSLRRVPAVKLGSEAARVVHDTATDRVYALIRGSARLAFSAVDGVLRRVERSPMPAALPAPSDESTDSRRRDDLVGALSGAVGDHMAFQRNPLAIVLGIYRRGQRVRADARGLFAAFPDATPKLALFVHGLCGTENVWDLYRRPDDAQTEPYGPRLARDLGYTPVYLRYNSGLRISRNGRALARLLEQVQTHWPVPLEEIVLIGHSMGGLVARSAADVGCARGDRWMASLRQIICLGTPHLGAPLEKVVHVGTHLMHRIALARPIARLLDARSLGIKDLRWGYTQHAEWKHRDPDAFWTADRLQSAPVPGVRYRFLGTCLTQSPDHLLTRALGDGLVRLPSSLAADVAGADSAMRAQLHHLRLLNHPDVYAQLKAWLAAADSADAPSPLTAG